MGDKTNLNWARIYENRRESRLRAWPVFYVPHKDRAKRTGPDGAAGQECHAPVAQPRLRDQYQPLTSLELSAPLRAKGKAVILVEKIICLE